MEVSFFSFLEAGIAAMVQLEKFTLPVSLYSFSHKICVFHYFSFFSAF
jgi:hypothetical protein